jgi:hypothetical protein
MKFIQTKIIDELFLIFFINYFIIICFFNIDFFYIIYDLLLTNLNLNVLFLINFFFFFVIPKKKRKKKKKIKTPIEQLISICKKAVFRIKLRKAKELLLTKIDPISYNNLPDKK